DDYGPVKVKVSLHITEIDSVDIHRGVFSPQIYFQQSWVDDRLKHDKTAGNVFLETVPSHVWIPDTMFQYVKSARLHTIPQPQHYIRIYPTGEVIYSQKLSLTLGCPMDLQLYPFDMHMCEIRMES
ncbi:unnamed protein product, partial [Meganyctiphanes norvegica]